MQGLIQELIVVIGLVGVLIHALRTTLKKGSLLLKDVNKFSTALKSFRGKKEAAPEQRDDGLRELKRRYYVLISLLSLSTLVLIAKMFDPTPLSRRDVVMISVQTAVMVALVALYFIRNILETQRDMFAVIGKIIEHREEKEPNQAPEPTAPSGRGSS